LMRVNPNERLKLETTRENLCGRVIDLLAPLGKGHRCLIAGPRNSGKKLLLESITNSIAINHPEAAVTSLFIDEDREEATVMVRSLRGEAMFSTSDELPTRHIQLAEMVLEKAKRLAERRREAVIFLHSITQLASAYNAVVPLSGEGLRAGLDVRAWRLIQQFFGAAGKFEGSGSLTIIATIEVGGAKSAEKALWNELNTIADAQIVLDRKVLDQGIFPAVN
jgi:transcription termination factor Rho